jgi:hypothetical protein
VHEGVWHPEYDKPLGAPKALAAKTGDTWTREFESGTVVTFNATSNVGHIAWAAATAANTTTVIAVE